MPHGTIVLHHVRQLTRFFLACAPALMIAATSGGRASAEDLRPWTVKDSVALRYITADTLYGVNLGSIKVPGTTYEHYSPDGSHFFVLSYSGDVDKDETEEVLWIYSTAEVRDALRRKASNVAPLRVLKMRSGFSTYIGAVPIQLPRWENDRSILFVGTEGRKARRPYRYTFATDRLTPLGPVKSDDPDLLHEGFTFGTSGQTVVYADTRHYLSDDWNRYPYSVLKPGSLNGTQRDGFSGGRADIYAWREGAPPRKLMTVRPNYGLVGPWVSPDEQWVVLIGKRWEEAGNGSSGFLLANVKTGEVKSATGAPGGWNIFRWDTRSWGGGNSLYDAYWSNDSRHVLLFNTELPGRKGNFVVDLDVSTGKLNTVTTLPQVKNPGDLKLARLWWGEQGSVLLADFNDGENKKHELHQFVYGAGGWKMEKAAAQTAAAKPTAFDIVVEESANDPQRLVAKSAGRHVRLMPDDPALKGLRRVPVETLKWKDANGESVDALLMLPPDPKPGEKFPLVVQLGDPFNPADEFRPDGEVGTAYAAQALAAQGFAVLQVESATSRERQDLSRQPAEAPAQVARIDDAVERMRARGITDDRPIGLIGFSRSAYYTYYIATHPGKTRIGAYVPYDGMTYNFGEYVLSAAMASARSSGHYGFQYVAGDTADAGRARKMGEGTFWSAPQAWLKEAPSFNVHRVQAPVLFSATGGLFFAAEQIGAFELARRPYEHLYFPEGGHIMFPSGQRYAVMQATVDWMNFWLQGKSVDGGALDPGRQQRWEGIRANWQKQQAWEKAGNAIGSIPDDNFEIPGGSKAPD